MKTYKGFIDYVPKRYIENLKFRRKIYKKMSVDDKFRGQIKKACARDILFFCNVFGWTYDPRLINPVVPFVTYGFQDYAIMKIRDNIREGRDLLIEKSRDMGATWMFILVYTWYFLYHKDKSFLLVSRKEDYVDAKGDPKTLFWKIDFLIEKLPKSMRVDIERTSMHIRNLENNSTIDGESTTGDVARGDRRTSIALDEFSAVDEGFSILKSVQDATRCVLYNGTPRGTANAYYEVRKSQIDVLSLHWSQHPEKSIGLYRYENGKALNILDKIHEFPPDYKFECDGRLRSIWYDEEVRRRRYNWREISEELDLNYEASSFRYFDDRDLVKHKEYYVRPPVMVGELEYNGITCEPENFNENELGRLKMWVRYDKNVIRSGEYVIGVDVSVGTGASNSAIVVYKKTSGEKIAEYVSSTINSIELSRYAMALGHLFSDRNGISAKIIFEINGEGRNFSRELVERGYDNVYFRECENGLTKKITPMLGFHSNKDSKKELLSDYREAIQSGYIINRSSTAVDECKSYVYNKNGEISHDKSMLSIDPTGARDNHGDIVIADALAYLLLKKNMKEQTIMKGMPYDTNNTGTYTNPRLREYIEKVLMEERNIEGVFFKGEYRR